MEIPKKVQDALDDRTELIRHIEPYIRKIIRDDEIVDSFLKQYQIQEARRIFVPVQEMLYAGFLENVESSKKAVMEIVAEEDVLDASDLPVCPFCGKPPLFKYGVPGWRRDEGDEKIYTIKCPEQHVDRYRSLRMSSFVENRRKPAAVSAWRKKVESVQEKIEKAKNGTGNLQEENLMKKKCPAKAKRR